MLNRPVNCCRCGKPLAHSSFMDGYCSVCRLQERIKQNNKEIEAFEVSGINPEDLIKVLDAQ